MDDLEKYVNRRKRRSGVFARDYERGYRDFKIGVLLRQAREQAGMTQEQVALKLHTRKTAISRIENHAEDIKLSTIEGFARAVGKELHIEVA